MSENVKAQIVKLPVKKARKPASKPATVTNKRNWKAIRQTLAGSMSGIVALGLLVLSLNHMTQGLILTLKASPLDALLMAVGIDLGFISLKVAMLFAYTAGAKRMIHRWAPGTIIGLMIVSGLLNAYAFATHAEDVIAQTSGVILGFLIPYLVFILSQVSVACLMPVEDKA